MDPGGDLLVQPTRVLESVTDGKMSVSVRHVPVRVVEKPTVNRLASDWRLVSPLVRAPNS